MNYATESPRGMTMPSRGNHKRARRWAAPALVVTLFLLSGFGAAVGNPLAPTAAGHLPGATHSGVSLPATGAATSSVSHSASSAGPKAGGGSNVTYIESGNGTFFNNTAVQNVTTGHGACGKYLSYTESCWNATLDPTVNVTTTGTTGMAYTVWTNETGCPAMQNATTEIGFVSSSDFGATWGTPIILGNPVCTVDSHNDSHYEDAEMPALTSLSNGTFVLSYVESNVSAANYFYYDSEYPMSVGCHYTDYDRVVVSESYNNGVTWTIPTVIQQTDISYTTTYDCANPGTGLVRPSLAATGNTVYLAYTEYPWYFQECCNYTVTYESFLHLVVSTNGGGTWTNASTPPYSWPGSLIAAYPDLTVTPSGELYISYVSGQSLTLVCTLYCQDVYNSTVMVAWSGDNGTTFNSSEVTQTANFYPYQDDGTDFLAGPFPQLAYSPSDGQLFVTYFSTQFGTYLRGTTRAEGTAATSRASRTSLSRTPRTAA